MKEVGEPNTVNYLNMSLPPKGKSELKGGKSLSQLNKPKCGEIWMCKLPASESSVQSGYRPVFVLSNDINNTYSSCLNVIPITSRMKRSLPVHVNIPNYKECGLSKPSTMLIEQITTVSIDALEKQIGKISEVKILQDINRAIRIQFPVVGICVS